MKSKENLFKNRMFSICSEIGQGKIEHRAKVLESYGIICLVEIQKGYVSGSFLEYGIFKIWVDKDKQEQLLPVNVDYEKSPNMPARYGGSKDEVFAMFEKLKSKMQLQESEDELRKDRKIKEDAKIEAERQKKAENLNFCKTRMDAILIELRENCRDNEVKKLLSDKNVRELMNEYYFLEKIKTCLPRY